MIKILLILFFFIAANCIASSANINNQSSGEVLYGTSDLEPIHRKWQETQARNKFLDIIQDPLLV